jgi:hypothetical protein
MTERDLSVSRREALAGAAATVLTALSASPASAGHNSSDNPVGDFAIQPGQVARGFESPAGFL